MKKILYPSFSFFPKYKSEITNWHQHMPFAYELIAANEPRLIVELGVHMGDSYFSICQSCKEHKTDSLVYGIDSWKGDSQAGFYDETVFRKVDHHNKINYGEFSYLIRKDFTEALEDFDDESIDLLHIDGLHSYESVAADFYHWLPKVRKGGIVLLHDTCVREGDFGVWKIWQEIESSYPSFHFDHGCGLGIMLKQELSGEMRLGKNLWLSESYAESIKKSFANAGAMIKMQEKITEAQNLSSNLSLSEAQLAKLKSKLVETKKLKNELNDKFQNSLSDLTKSEKKYKSLLAIKDKNLKDKEIQLAELENSSADLQLNLKESEKRLFEMENDFSEKIESYEKTLLELKTQVHSSDAECKKWKELYQKSENEVLVLSKKRISDKKKFKEKIIELSYEFDEAQNTLSRFMEKSSQHAELSDKLERIKNSISWKITSPLRFLRRVTLDRFFASNPNPALDGFDPKIYLELNPDLKKIFGKDILAAKKHYLMHGIGEGRPSNLSLNNNGDYERWLNLYDKLNYEDLRSRAAVLKRKKKTICFSIILPVFNPRISHLSKALDSVLNQVYENWELCIADDASTDQKVISLLKKYQAEDSRIKISFRRKNGHISESSNTAIGKSTGDYLVFLDHDDELRPHSLLCLAETLHDFPKLRFIYSDEDKIDDKGKLSAPYFKPDWNPDLLIGQNYICHLSCVDRELILQVGGFRKGYEGSQDWDLFLRVTSILKDEEIFHLSKVLYHWRAHKSSTAKNMSSKSYAVTAAKKCIQDHLKRNNIKGRVDCLDAKSNIWQVKYTLPSMTPKVSIIIPTRNHCEILRTCIESLIAKTSYSKYEIILLDNDTDDESALSYLDFLKKFRQIRIFKEPGAFNYSKLNNSGASYAKGEILVLLNNDIEILQSDWLEIMVTQVLRPSIGCVGAKLLYPNDTIQHAGVVTGIGGIAGHPYKGMPMNFPGYFSRLLLTQNFDAVTGACLAVRKSVFEEAKGLDEKNLKVAFSDIDFCLKVGKLGLRNLLVSNVVHRHHESYTRGLDDTGTKKDRFKREVDYMFLKWGALLRKDRSYNRNLTLQKEDFSLAYPPRMN